MLPMCSMMSAQAGRGASPVDTLDVPGRLAQLGERRLDKAEVAGSSPASPIARTRWKRRVFLCPQRRRGEGSDRAASSWRPPFWRLAFAYYQWTTCFVPGVLWLHTGRTRGCTPALVNA